MDSRVVRSSNTRRRLNNTDHGLHVVEQFMRKAYKFQLTSRSVERSPRAGEAGVVNATDAGGVPVLAL